MSNTVFCYGLTPLQLSAYSYLVSCSGRKGSCYPSMRRIARSCGCSVNGARAALDELERREFIRKVHTFAEDEQGRSRQTNNTYYVLPLPEPKPVTETVYRQVASANESPSPLQRY